MPTDRPEPATLATLLLAADQMGAPGWVLLAGRGFGPPRLLFGVTERSALAANFTEPEAAALVRGLVPPKEGERVFLLGYEAAASQCLDAPRFDHDPSLGPVGFVRDFAASAVLAVGPGARGLGGRWPLTLTGPDAHLGRFCSSLGEVEQATAPWAPEAPVLSAAAGEQERHMRRVSACIEALRAGVLYQANLAHRLSVQPTTRAGALAWFADRLAAAAPPFAAIADLPGWGLMLSLSPECFLHWDLTERTVETWPVKGTRPRHPDPATDAALAAELKASVKDQAEHVMIVDLLRNDLGKVAEVGGVEVRELMRALTTDNVHHLETTIAARLRRDVGLPELLLATAPGGSITGAPKSTALEVIQRLEAGPRGAYTGNLGVVDAEGRGAASILIRTWLRPDEGEGALHVGGGIVVGSAPAAEWQETLDKASAFGAVRA